MLISVQGVIDMLKVQSLPLQKINIKKAISKIHIPRLAPSVNFMYAALSFLLSMSKIMGGMTPFGTAFFAAVCTAKNVTPTFSALVLGSIIAHPSGMCLSYVLTGAAVAFMNILWDKPVKPVIKATITGVLLFGAKTVASSRFGIFAYDMIVNFTEALICGMWVCICAKSEKVLFPRKRRTFLSYEETISVICVLSAVLMSFNNIPALFGIKIGNVLSICAILILNHASTSSAGIVAGVIAGVINSVGTYNSGAVIGAYAFSALVSSMLSRFGKTALCLGFVLANTAITVFLNGSTEVLINIYEILIATALFFPFSDKIADAVSHLLHISNAGKIKNDGNVQFAYGERLKRISDSLKSLSESFVTDSASTDIRDISVLVNKTAEKTCSNCSLRYCCWQKKAGETKSAILTLLSRAQKSGKAYVKDVPDDLKNRCIRTEKLVSSFNDSYEMYRTSRMWQSRVDDCKALSAEQLGSVSKLLEEMAQERHLLAEEDTVIAIRTALDAIGIPPKTINACVRGDGNLSVEIKYPKNKYRDDIRYMIAPSLSEAVGVKMRFNEAGEDGKYVYLNYSMCEKFCRATGAASIKKDGEKVCGDSFAAMNLSNGTYFAAISDGMGSGEEASFESRKTIDLIKNFLRCGFGISHAAKLINSSLLLTGKDDYFATVDLCSVNMHTGEAKFIKVGGASTYIKTGSHIEKISNSSLPAGIIDGVKPGNFSRKLGKESLVVMVSDGVENASVDDEWLRKWLSEADSVNPHVIADKILDTALFYSGGKAKDDMTVVATRIWEENV